jgi:hypothetical protein
MHCGGGGGVAGPQLMSTTCANGAQTPYLTYGAHPPGILKSVSEDWVLATLSVELAHYAAANTQKHLQFCVAKDNLMSGSLIYSLFQNQIKLDIIKIFNSC